MLLLGHVGIALGAAQLAETVRGRLLRRRTGEVSRIVDLRFLALGSLLPDIIDKPLGLVILPNVLETTRSVGHTLAFAAVLLVIGFLHYRRSRKLLLLSLGIGVLSHLILDTMWSTPQTLLWPSLGWGFPRGGSQGLSDYVLGLWHHPWEQRSLIISEGLGGLVMGSFLLKLWRERVSASLKATQVEGGVMLTSRDNVRVKC